MEYTFEAVKNEKMANDNDYVEIRKGQKDVGKSLGLCQWDIVVLQKENGKEVKAIVIGYDEITRYYAGMLLSETKKDGQYEAEANVRVSDDVLEKYYTNPINDFIKFSETCISSIYGFIISDDLLSIEGKFMASFRLHADVVTDSAKSSNNQETSSAYPTGKLNNKSSRAKKPQKNAMTVIAVALKEQNKKLSNENMTLRKRLENTEDKTLLSANKEEIKGLKNKIAMLTSENYGQDKRIRDLTDNNKKFAVRNEQLEKTVNEKNEELKKQKSVIMHLTDESLSWNQKQDELSKEIEAYKTEKQSLLDKNRQLISDNETLKSKFDELTNAVNGDAEKNASLREENEALKKMLRKLQDEREKESEVVTKPTPANHDAELKIHDLELTVKIYKALYLDMIHCLKKAD